MVEGFEEAIIGVVMGTVLEMTKHVGLTITGAQVPLAITQSLLIAGSIGAVVGIGINLLGEIVVRNPPI